MEVERIANCKKRSQSFVETLNLQVQRNQDERKARKELELSEDKKVKEAYAKDPYLFMLFPKMKFIPDNEKKQQIRENQTSMLKELNAIVD